MKRRSVLLASVAAVAGLAGCKSVPQLISDALLIETKFESFIPLLNAIPGVPAADVAALQTLTGDISQAATLAGTLYPTVAPAAANSTLQNVEKAIEGALTIATTAPISGLIAGATAAVPGLSALPLALQAASVLVPGLFAAFGLPAPVGASYGLTADEARAVLSAPT